MKILHRLAGIFLSFALLIILLITAFETAMYSDYGVYRKEYEKYDVLSDLGMTMEDVMYVTGEMMEYLRGNREELSVVTTVEGREQDFFNEQDRFHMGEVRELFLGGLALRRWGIGLAVLLAAFLFLTKADWKKEVPSSVRIGIRIVFAAVILIGIAALVDFNAVFVEFHHIFFDNDKWLFDPAEDYMIRMLPEGLFADMTAKIGLRFAGGALLLSVATFLPGLAGQRRGKTEP